MRRTTTRARATAAGALALTAAVLAGCSFGDPGIDPDDVDAARVAALADDPFVAGWKVVPAKANHFRSVNVAAYRAHVTTTEDRTQDAWASSVEFVADLRAAGWEVRHVACYLSDDTTSLYLATEITATTVDDGVTAIMQARVNDRRTTATAAVPFHTEDTDPWGLTAPEGEFCIDQDVPPTTSSPSAGAPVDLTTVDPT
ncbi:hypothetical protein CLV28_1141 [Sediminihabitans luteus]|uniref:Lipoprotein n=2 Tax=Sediminihabitans luteus TaxID=1138585 RepID=A0A2M9D1F7_9CELL|nr:hypothetical protein CLV28_1141 [Sediminihabitans luteus]GII99728.1 hypothetical protein Slu03_21060 [Sediminihabitans luteus]